MAAAAQGLAAALVGAFAASIIEPPEGAAWLLLGGAIACAGAAAWARSAVRGDRE